MIIRLYLTIEQRSINGFVSTNTKFPIVDILSGCLSQPQIDTPTVSGSQKAGLALLLKIQGLERQTLWRGRFADYIVSKVESMANNVILMGASAGGPAASWRRGRISGRSAPFLIAEASTFTRRLIHGGGEAAARG